MENGDWVWITLEDAVTIHQQNIAEFGGLDGLRDMGALQSALAYPKNMAAYGTPAMAELAAGYLFALAKNHAFVDGNKRTAWVVTRLFIKLNGGNLVFDKLEAVKFVEAVAGSLLEQKEITSWLEARP